ncbi:MAG TPA: hypothetical protein VJJ83_04860 [Candidatus Babeliales bacterium]|nr:hypothetical protein [Candidatus Babeliales bacterium]
MNKLLLVALAAMALIAHNCAAMVSADRVSEELQGLIAQFEVLGVAVTAVTEDISGSGDNAIKEVGSWLRAINAKVVEITAALSDLRVSVDHGVRAEGIRASMSRSYNL